MSRHLSQSYSVLVVTAGGGHLATEDGSSLLIGRGSTVVIPHSAGPAVLSGDIEGVRCLPAVTFGRPARWPPAAWCFRLPGRRRPATPAARRAAPARYEGK